MRRETCCRHIGYSYQLSARALLYAPSHRQDNTYHGLCYTSRGALAGTRNSSMGPPHEGIDPTTHRTMSERSYHGAASRSMGWTLKRYNINQQKHVHRPHEPDGFERTGQREQWSEGGIWCVWGQIYCCRNDASRGTGVSVARRLSMLYDWTLGLLTPSGTSPPLSLSLRQ